MSTLLCTCHRAHHPAARIAAHAPPSAAHSPCSSGKGSSNSKNSRASAAQRLSDNASFCSAAKDAVESCIPCCAQLSPGVVGFAVPLRRLQHECLHGCSARKQRQSATQQPKAAWSVPNAISQATHLSRSARCCATSDFAWMSACSSSSSSPESTSARWACRAAQTPHNGHCRGRVQERAQSVVLA